MAGKEARPGTLAAGGGPNLAASGLLGVAETAGRTPEPLVPAARGGAAGGAARGAAKGEAAGAGGGGGGAAGRCPETEGAIGSRLGSSEGSSELPVSDLKFLVGSIGTRPLLSCKIFFSIERHLGGASNEL